MNKAEFVDHITKENKLSKVEAEKMLNIITNSIVSALAQGDEISLVGFGKFYTTAVAAREGRNPKTGEVLSIHAYKQVKFSAGQSLKNACNSKTAINNSKDNKNSSSTKPADKVKKS